MPDGRTHQAVGTAAGALAAAVRTRPEDGDVNVIVTIGGGLGGFIASRWPDLLEPAVCPHHRQIAHSALAGGSVLRCALRAVPEWESHWRAVALDARRRRHQSDAVSVDQMLVLAIELFAWMLVGLLSGLAAGYVSHLVLDGCTPAGLPLIGLCDRSAAPIA